MLSTDGMLLYWKEILFFWIKMIHISSASFFSIRSVIFVFLRFMIHHMRVFLKIYVDISRDANYCIYSIYAMSSGYLTQSNICTHRERKFIVFSLFLSCDLMGFSWNCQHSCRNNWSRYIVDPNKKRNLIFAKWMECNVIAVSFIRYIRSCICIWSSGKIIFCAPLRLYPSLGVVFSSTDSIN